MASLVGTPQPLAKKMVSICTRKNLLTGALRGSQISRKTTRPHPFDQLVHLLHQSNSL
jgi:hypothetical protein